MIEYSIQGADLSIRKESRAQTANKLVNIFESYDWASEHALESQLELDNQEFCPAGLIILREPYVFLHLCPRPSGTVLTHCVHTALKKVLGIFKFEKSTNLAAENLSRNIAIQAITKFFNADNDWLLTNIKED